MYKPPRSEDQIPSAEILAEFNNVDYVEFPARPNNVLEYRRLVIGRNLGIGISLQRVFELLEIAPAQLRDLFDAHPLPAEISSYDQLNGFPLDPQRFAILAKLLNKTVVVLREDGGSGGSYYLFTVHPDGTVVEAEPE